MNTSDLSADSLDYWVAIAAKCTCEPTADGYIVRSYSGQFLGYIGDAYVPNFKPSANWSQGGMLIESVGISLMPDSHLDEKDSKIGMWCAQTRDQAAQDIDCWGSTPLQAAMIAFVTQKIGATVPDEVQA